MSDQPTTIDEYLDRLDPEPRDELERIRRLVHYLVPGLTETVSYRMPTLRYRDRPLVFFTASKRHMSFYPSPWALDELRDRLADYSRTEHAIRFTLAHPLPDDLIADLVRVHVHVREIDAGRR